MRARHAAVAIVALAAIVGAPVRAYAQEEALPVVELLADPTRYAGRGVVVTLEGELVGDYGRRTDGWTWAQLNDDAYAARPLLDGGGRFGGNVGVAIRMPHVIADGLEPPGGYRRVGPVVRVRGAWKFRDAERGGESYLEVTDLEVVSPARAVSQPFSWSAATAGVALLGAAGALWRTRRRGR